ncbi:hypothetical protein [Arthrobacter sp. H5]|uniref:hypothetical protein n=1 Tax=Arthrobacter sp. H5 TaxID=1267973 RepID=UPI000481A50B|nr:hypothetical protein [Arthrobacter sp. H5]
MEQTSVEHILQRYFAANSVGKHPVTAARYARVEAHLLRYLEYDGAASLDPRVAVLLALERQFEARAAFSRLLGAEELVFALPRFLGQEWLLEDFHDRLAQISLISRLVQWLCGRQLVDSRWHRHAVIQTRAAAEKARRRAVT